VGLLRAAGAEPIAVRSLPALETVLPGVDGVVIDLTARAYDGIEAAAAVQSARKLAFAIGQHDDVELRRRAHAVGAIFAPYRRLTSDGFNLIEMWLSGTGLQESPR
jgi:hypothetical protein